MTYVSSLSLSSPIRQSVLQAQSALTQAQTEISSGAPADLGLTLGSRTGTVLSLRSQIDQLNGYTSSNASAATRLSATASTLSTLLSTAQTTAASLLTASSSGGDIDSVSTSAQGALSALASGLNTSVAGESLFGGINTGQTPVADYFSTPTSATKAAVDSAYADFIANNGGDPSTITAAQFQTFLSDKIAPLFSSAGWTGSQGLSVASSTTAQTAISPTQTISTSVSANESAFRQVAEAYTVLGAFTGSGSTLSAAAKAAAAGAATTLLSSGTAGLTGLQAKVGVAQQSVDAANTQVAAQTTTLQSSVGDLDSVDVYALSSQVTTLQNQLEASYELTSRLQSLSLTSYLSS